MQQIQTFGLSLHKACEAPQSLPLIHSILVECPEAALFVAHEGNLPIHTACLNQANEQVLRALVRHDPSCLVRTDAHGNYPLHLATFSGAPLSSVKYLVQKNPETIFERNGSGETPLDRAKNPFFGVVSKDVVEWLENPYFYHKDEFDEHDDCGGVDVEDTMASTMAHDESCALPHRRASSIHSFLKPLDVEETRSAISALQRSKSDPNKTTTQTCDGSDQRSGDNTMYKSHHLSPSLFAPREEPLLDHGWKDVEHVSVDLKASANHAHHKNNLVDGSISIANKPSNIRGPLKASKKEHSSFYQSALREHVESQTVLQQDPTSLFHVRRPSDAEPQPMYPNVNASAPTAESSKQQQRPGVVMVNEPAIHPNSAMFRAAYS